LIQLIEIESISWEIIENNWKIWCSCQHAVISIGNRWSDV